MDPHTVHESRARLLLEAVVRQHQDDAILRALTHLFERIEELELRLAALEPQAKAPVPQETGSQPELSPAIRQTYPTD